MSSPWFSLLLEPDFCPETRPDCAQVDTRGHRFVAHERILDVATLDPVGAALFDLLDGTVSMAELASLIGTELGAPNPQEYALGFTKALAKTGLLRRVFSPDQMDGPVFPALLESECREKGLHLSEMRYFLLKTPLRSYRVASNVAEVQARAVAEGLAEGAGSDDHGEVETLYAVGAPRNAAGRGGWFHLTDHFGSSIFRCPEQVVVEEAVTRAIHDRRWAAAGGSILRLPALVGENRLMLLADKVAGAVTSCERTLRRSGIRRSHIYLRLAADGSIGAVPPEPLGTDSATEVCWVGRRGSASEVDFIRELCLRLVHHRQADMESGVRFADHLTAGTVLFFPDPWSSLGSWIIERFRSDAGWIASCP